MKTQHEQVKEALQACADAASDLSPDRRHFIGLAKALTPEGAAKLARMLKP